eukprot:m.693055 g.693055  ORF g.693055 m.693055 type:complete len:581 (-) comp22869_c0_seq1:3701-5443(-)
MNLLHTPAQHLLPEAFLGTAGRSHTSANKGAVHVCVDVNGQPDKMIMKTVLLLVLLSMVVVFGGSTANNGGTTATAASADEWAQHPKPTITDMQITLICLWMGSLVALGYRKLVKSPPVRPSLDGDPDAEVKDPNELLSNIVIFGAIMFYMWLLDDRQVLSIHGKTYNRDTFLFICLTILLWSSSTLKKSQRSGVLSREQTDEWKGWMQIMFLLYHYFAAKEFYNLIRVLIASYVWMTGFGNFLYFKGRGDYSLWRVLKMLFRLNFLVVAFCLLMDTDYVLYYICPMHTVWFLSVYAMMAIKPSWNNDNTKLAAKFAVYFVIVGLVWEVPAIFEAVWSPFQFMLATEGSMHEWTFRTTLDHWCTFIGMLCAWFMPSFKTWMSELEERGGPSQIVQKGGVFVVGFGVVYMWFTRIFLLQKFDYNQHHPYFSFIPIVYYIFVRNVIPSFRDYHLGLLEQAGKITLETYLCQFHMWMCRHNNAYVGALIEIIPTYPLLNFMLVSAIYIALSNKLFDLTVSFSGYMLLPKAPKGEDDWKLIRYRWAGLAGTICCAFVVIAIYRHIMHGPVPDFQFGSLSSLNNV